MLSALDASKVKGRGSSADADAGGGIINNNSNKYNNYNNSTNTLSTSMSSSNLLFDPNQSNYSINNNNNSNNFNNTSSSNIVNEDGGLSRGQSLSQSQVSLSLARPSSLSSFNPDAVVDSPQDSDPPSSGKENDHKDSDKLNSDKSIKSNKNNNKNSSNSGGKLSRPPSGRNVNLTSQANTRQQDGA